MPSYEYACQTDGCKCGKFELFFSTLGKAKPFMEEAKCPECLKKAPRMPSLFSPIGAKSFTPQKDVAVAMSKAADGTPIFKDENGKTCEVRTTRDIDKWTVSNQLGMPRMVDHKNHITGKWEQIPKRTVMRFDPTTGEQLDVGSIVREKAKLVPLPDNFEMPSESKAGRPMENGVVKDMGNLKHRLIDPETGQRTTWEDMWGGASLVGKTPRAGARVSARLAKEGGRK